MLVAFGKPLRLSADNCLNTLPFLKTLSTLCMKNFKELKIWQKGFQIAKNCFAITQNFPQQEKYGLASQINRAAVSIASNIAEGSGRSSANDYKRFVEIALGSCFEVETQLLLSRELSFGEEELINKTLDLLVEEEKMLVAFGKTLKLSANS